MSKRKEGRIIKIKELEKRIVALNGSLETIIASNCFVPVDRTKDDRRAYKDGYYVGVQSARRALWSYFKEVLEPVHGKEPGVYSRW